VRAGRARSQDGSRKSNNRIHGPQIQPLDSL
jgi:hypothetical protein